MSITRCTIRQVKLSEDKVILVVETGDAASSQGLRLRQVTIDVDYMTKADAGRLQVTEAICGTVESDGPLVSLHFARARPGSVLRSLEASTGEASRLEIDPQTRLCMGITFPLDDNEFEKAFSRRASRWQDARSIYLVARQICRHFPGSPAFRCAAGVVLCYKAAEIGDARMADEALAIARGLLPVADGCPRHWHPRRNGEQLAVSLLMAMWHVHLGMNDAVALRAALDGLVARHGTITHYLTPSNAMCRSFLLYGLLLLRTGETDQARSLFRLTIKAYQRGVADIDNVRRISFIKDLEASHRAAILAAEAMRSKFGAAGIDGDAVLQECLRVSGSAFDRLKKNFVAISSLTVTPIVPT